MAFLKYLNKFMEAFPSFVENMKIFSLYAEDIVYDACLDLGLQCQVSNIPYT